MIYTKYEQVNVICIDSMIQKCLELFDKKEVYGICGQRLVAILSPFFVKRFTCKLEVSIDL